MEGRGGNAPLPTDYLWIPPKILWVPTCIYCLLVVLGAVYIVVKSIINNNLNRKNIRIL